MDPNNPRQAPGESPPPQWSVPPAPDQQGSGVPPSPWGAPPSPDQQGSGVPPAPDQQGYGVPPAPDQQGYGVPPSPYGAPQGQFGGPPPTWGIPAPTSKPSRVPRIIGAVAIVVVLIAAGLVAYSLTSGRSGKIVFSTDVPQSGTHTGCTINNQVTTIGATTAVYATYIFGSTLGSEEISLSITKDGTTFFPTTPIPTSDTQGIDCFSDTTDLSQLPSWGPGKYHFSATSGSTTEAEGDLTVK